MWRCSSEANKLWGDILRAHRCYRDTEDAQRHGRDFNQPRSTGVMDIGTDARLLRIASVGCLSRLSGGDAPQRAASELAGRRIESRTVWEVCEKHGLSRCEARHDGNCKGCDEHRLNYCVKEWLYWALEDGISDEPELPWVGVSR